MNIILIGCCCLISLFIFLFVLVTLLRYRDMTDGPTYSSASQRRRLGGGIYTTRNMSIDKKTGNLIFSTGKSREFWKHLFSHDEV